MSEREASRMPSRRGWAMRRGLAMLAVASAAAWYWLGSEKSHPVPAARIETEAPNEPERSIAPERESASAPKPASALAPDSGAAQSARGKKLATGWARQASGIPAGLGPASRGFARLTAIPKKLATPFYLKDFELAQHAESPRMSFSPVLGDGQNHSLDGAFQGWIHLIESEPGIEIELEVAQRFREEIPGAKARQAATDYALRDVGNGTWRRLTSIDRPQAGYLNPFEARYSDQDQTLSYGIPVKILPEALAARHGSGLVLRGKVDAGGATDEISGTVHSGAQEVGKFSLRRFQ